MDAAYPDEPLNAAESQAPSPRRFILASASPRRQQLLREAGYDFTVHPANINEDDHPPDLLPMELARHLALEKAKAVAALYPDEVVLGADTVVAFGDQSLGKPTDAQEARNMLWLLSGTTHVVITGVSVIRRADRFEQTRIAMSAVRMRALLPREIDAYVATRQWEGKAGGYGIQDHDPFVTRMSGSQSNIVGLPIDLAAELLADAGVYPRETASP